jgi:hypothetical protein
MFRPFSTALILMAGAAAASGGHPRIARDLHGVTAKASQQDTVRGYGGSHRAGQSQIGGAAHGLAVRAPAGVADNPIVAPIPADQLKLLRAGVVWGNGVVPSASAVAGESTPIAINVEN